MYKLAILTSAYSYGIFALGILGILTRPAIIVISLVFITLGLKLFGKDAKIETFKKLDKFGLFLLLILSIQAAINILGAFGPELAFDALWYHLTIPKIFISEEKIFFIPGGLLYYSAMPKLIEMLYIPALVFGNEIVAKLIHFSFGVLTLFVLYKLSRFFLSRTKSLLVLVVFYSNLVVAFQSTTAYIDLGRTFFEVLSLFFLVSYLKDKRGSALTKSAVSAGLAISSKLLSVGTLFVYVVILLLRKIDRAKMLRFLLIALLVPSPWFIFSYINTGNPFHPFFTETYRVSPEISVSSLANFIRSPDPISPIYLISLPLAVVSFKRFDNLLRTITFYSLLSFLVWFITQGTGGGRFIMPYLPAFSLISVAAATHIKNDFLNKFIIWIIIFLAATTIIYRGAANAKYAPVILGVESKSEFLARQLNFEFGDFYDIDGYFTKNIKEDDRVLIYGIHNLYYVDFPFIHESWLKSNDYYNYVLVRDLQVKDPNLKLVYTNKKTNVKLYKVYRERER